MRIALIIPTYNEAKVIGSLLDRLPEIRAEILPHDIAVVVVDGNSTDKTADIVREKSKADPHIYLISEGKKEGIAVAYVAGINYAKNTLKADAFLEFDGDGQHDPSYIPVFVKAFLDGFDLVIGSRYVLGGSIPKNWPWQRKVLSRFGSIYARVFLELPVYDVTSGFKLTRMKGFGEFLPESTKDLLSRRYAYKMQFLHELILRGARVKEIPIDFRTRDYDYSKSTWRDIFDSLRVTFILRMSDFKSWRLPKVLLIGGIGFVIQTILFELIGIRSGILRPSLAAVVGGEAAILSNFSLNNAFTFKDKARAASLLKRVLRFHIVSSGSIGTQWFFVFIAEHICGNDPIFLRVAYISGIIIGFLINYAGYQLYVWKKER